MKRDGSHIYVCSKQSIAKYLNQYLTVSPICMYLSVCLLPESVCLLCQKISRYIKRRKEYWKKDKNGTLVLKKKIKIEQ